VNHELTTSNKQLKFELASANENLNRLKQKLEESTHFRKTIDDQKIEITRLTGELEALQLNFDKATALL
jgi:DNA repair exonuclease SbcCD ATPase subunit